MDITIFFFFAKFYLSFFSFCLTTADGKQLPVFFYPMYSLFGNCWNSKEQFGVNLKVTWEKAMAPHSSTLAWKIPWMEEPGGLQSMGSRRAGHDWATSLSRIGEGNGNPLQCSCLDGKMAYLFIRRQGISSHLQTIYDARVFHPVALLKLMFL